RYAKSINRNNVKLSCDPSIRYLKKISPEELKQNQEVELLLIPHQKKCNEQTECIQQYDILKNYFSKIKVCPAQKTDEKIAKLIADRLGAEVYLNIDDVDKIISLILSSNFVISERFHPSVVAAYFSIPFISVENSKTVRFFRKYTDRKDFFANSILDIPKRIEIVKNAPLNLKNEMDKEADKSFNELYKLMIKLSSQNV
ncbi:MAG: polysaccharide pyruvyl transferase family protein, partial [Fervidobacterium sp.]